MKTSCSLHGLRRQALQISNTGALVEAAAEAERYNALMHREACERLARRLDSIHAQGRYLGVQPEDVLVDKKFGEALANSGRKLAEPVYKTSSGAA